jgi:hypothetical protein
MPRGKSSGISLTNNDARVVLGMVARDDRDHDIAAWFGVNQGRIAEVKQGEYGNLGAAPATELPPKGPPGPKGHRLRTTVKKVIALLADKGDAGTTEALVALREGLGRYEANES